MDPFQTAVARRIQCLLDDSAAARRQGEAAQARARTLRAVSSAYAEEAGAEPNTKRREIRSYESALAAREAEICEQQARIFEAEAARAAEQAGAAGSRAQAGRHPAGRPADRHARPARPRSRGAH